MLKWPKGPVQFVWGTDSKGGSGQRSARQTKARLCRNMKPLSKVWTLSSQQQEATENFMQKRWKAEMYLGKKSFWLHCNGRGYDWKRQGKKLGDPWGAVLMRDDNRWREVLLSSGAPPGAVNSYSHTFSLGFHISWLLKKEKRITQSGLKRTTTKQNTRISHI